MGTTELITPDLVERRVAPPARMACVDGDVLAVEWADGTSGRFHRLVLAENAGEGVVDPLTHERLLDPTSPAADRHLGDASVTNDHHVEVQWTDGERTTIHGGWLHDWALGAWHHDDGVPAAQPWDTSTLAVLPTHDGPAAMADDDALETLLAEVCRGGVVRLRDLPTDDGTVLRVCERIGTVRDTYFGRSFDVRSRPDADTTAYTAHPLLPHTDLPTREMPPGYQLLHCRINECDDGLSVMVDGFAVANEVRRRDPHAFANLCATRWVHTNRSRHHDYRWSGPVVALDHRGELAEIRLLHALRTMPEVAEGATDAAYAALRLFTEVSTEPAFAIRSRFEPGDLVMFDNRRILHGRDRFDPNRGARHLQGCYIDRDDVHSRLRILQRIRIQHERENDST